MLSSKNVLVAFSDQPSTVRVGWKLTRRLRGKKLVTPSAAVDPRSRKGEKFNLVVIELDFTLTSIDFKVEVLKDFTLTS